jgi:hypothetical protein
MLEQSESESVPDFGNIETNFLTDSLNSLIFYGCEITSNAF